MPSEIAKKLAFEILGNVDPVVTSARLGRLSIAGRKDVDTPNFFAVSSRGVIPHMTPDVVASNFNGAGIHIAIEDFIEKKEPPVLKCPGPSPLHTFTALPRTLFTLLAPRRTPAVMSPNANTNTTVSVFTSDGFRQPSNKQYISMIQKLQPDICIPLADIAYGTKPGVKRITKMPGRTEKWVADHIQDCEHQTIFAPILPIDFSSQWEYVNSLEEQANRIAGLAFYDSSLLPDIPATTAMSSLPRLSLDEPASPHHILRQVSLGMDIFTIPFVGFATDAGISLTFTFPKPSSSTENNLNDSGLSTVPLGIDMWNTSHASSTIPITPSCTCYTCTSHHMAFIQHLLSAKEMLGWALIQIHNQHIISEFFKAVRASIKNGTFEMDSEGFARYYESELPAKSGQGPRMRGYHFKSEASEPKRNEKPWTVGLDAQYSALVPDTAVDLKEKEFAEKTTD
ncbi:putative Queuine tRNA-ribosyltransferase-like protein [Calycina marina]|uniref:Queuine tRNA-ribosyltransferase accessory subunit 2 n=1 Tax=Calycina marina TaxID=1763456 RepID=A0A9P8CFR4_9HELO|nr:putative Queuine tRNA-ribosyltransferase-like protein [Calycina marina]